MEKLFWSRGRLCFPEHYTVLEEREQNCRQECVEAKRMRELTYKKVKAQEDSLDLHKENITQSLALSEDRGKEVGY